MTHYISSSDCPKQHYSTSEKLRPKSAKMNISGFVMHEQKNVLYRLWQSVVLNKKLKISSFITAIGGFLYKITNRDLPTSKVNIVLDAELESRKNLEEPSWNGQLAHKKMRVFKLSYFGGIPTSRIAHVLKKINVEHFNLQYAGLAILTIPALIQLTAQPLTYDPNVLHDVVQTGSIPPKSDFWEKGWRTQYGRALQVFNLEAPETFGAVLSYKTRSHMSGLKEDVMSWRKSSEAKIPQALMVIQKDMPARGFDTSNIHDEIIKRTKNLDLSLTKISPLSTIPSKFGPLEVLDVILADKTKAQHACVTFRTQAMQPNLKLSGWLCADPLNAIERPQVSCFINRLDIIGATQDTSLQKIFQNVEKQRGNCTSRTNYGLDNTKKGGNWLDVKSPLPVLKGTLASKEGI